MISITSIYFGSLKGVLAVPFAASQHAVCFGSQISEATRAMLTPHRPGKLTAGQTPTLLALPCQSASIASVANHSGLVFSVCA